MRGRFAFTAGVRIGWSCLDALCRAGHVPSLAIGYPPSLSDRSGYRSLEDLSRKYSFQLLETEDINSPESLARLREAAPDVHLVFGWSQLLSKELLSVPTRGTLGTHPTRLPEGRGRAPIPWTLIKGLTRSAVTLFYLEEGVDCGDIVDQPEFDIGPEDDAGTLYEKIERVHVRMILENIDAVLKGTAPRKPQDHSKATYWPRRRPEDGKIDWSRPAGEIFNWVRGLTHPYPGAFTFLKGKKLLLWRAAQGGEAKAAPGTVVEVGADGMLVACGRGALRVLAIQLEGDVERTALEAARRAPLRKGDLLGS